MSSSASERADGDAKVSSVSVQPVQTAQNDSQYISHAYSSANRNDPVLTETKMRRLFNFTQLLAFALTFMSSWEVIAMNLGASFWNGGPRGLAWGSILVIIGSLSQAMSMAELGSIMPIAGAQYHWTDMLAPDKNRRFITWMQGWVTWFAWVSALAGSTSGEGFILQGLISYNYPDYSAERWHLTLIMIGLLIVTGLINTYTFRIVPWLELFAGVMHVILFVIFVAVLGALGTRRSADFVFTDSSTGSGWSNNKFVAFNIGMLVPAWGFIGFDGVNHMSEEVRKAKQAVPRAMILTILINGVLAFIISLVLLFYMGDPADSLDSVYPIIPILINTTGSLKVANAMVSGLIIITFCVIAASLASVGRITYAWSRDGALPKWFSHVDSKQRVPVRALWLPIVIVSLLSLLNIGSTSATAFSAFTALSSLGLYTSYIVAISVTLHARLTGRLSDHANAHVKYGGWRIKPHSLAVPINIYALIWTCYITVFLPFPTSTPVSGSNMNYALPIYAFVICVALVYWWAWGKRNWPGLNAAAIAMVDKES